MIGKICHMEKIKSPKGQFSFLNFQKFGWWKEHYKLRRLHQYLIGRIKCDFVSFENHFTNDNPIPNEKVVYHGTGTELIHLFSNLINEFYIPDTRNIHLLICDHFCKPDGTHFNPESLRKFKDRGYSLKEKRFIEKLFSAIEAKQTA